jgi:hypothetical protein
MRLINTRTLDLSEFFGSDTPKYAVLSHTWEKNGEITYQEWITRDRTSVTHKSGYQKIIGACQKAYSHEIEWLWVDTNCIDKTSSAELSEAINSMFTWYHNSVECYVYLADVNIPRVGDVGRHPLFRQSRWFTRGWALQELLAPTSVLFYSRDWVYLGSRQGSLVIDLSETTGIDASALSSVKKMSEASVAAKMSWLSRRETTRVEDLAYCMLGIFDLNMPLLYGEGPKAFTRLQEEIIKTSNDHSVFAWSWDDDVPPDWTSILAPSPRTFRYAADLVPSRDPGINIYSITNSGLSIELPVKHSMGTDWVVLDVTSDRFPRHRPHRACIPIAGYFGDVGRACERRNEPRTPMMLPQSPYRSVLGQLQRTKVFINSRPSRFNYRTETESTRNSISSATSAFRFGVLLFVPASIAKETATEWADWISTTPPDAMDSSGIFRFGRVDGDEDLSYLLISFRTRLIYVAVSRPERRRSRLHADCIWYLKTWSPEDDTDDIQKLNRAVKSIEGRLVDPITARDRYGFYIGVGDVVELEDAKESRAISLDEDLKPVLSADEQLRYLCPQSDEE